MNWIDKKYQDELGDRKFPKSMKEQGWQKAQQLLDEEFPVPASATKAVRWRYGIGVLVLLVGLTGGVWWFSVNEGNSGQREISYYSPRSEPMKVPAKEFDASSFSAPVESTAIKPVANGDALEMMEKVSSVETETTTKRTQEEVVEPESGATSGFSVEKVESVRDSEYGGQLNEEGNFDESISGNARKSIAETTVPIEVKSPGKLRFQLKPQRNQLKKPLQDARFPKVHEKAAEESISNAEPGSESQPGEGVVQTNDLLKGKDTEFALTNENKESEEVNIEGSENKEQFTSSPGENQVGNDGESTTESPASENTEAGNWHLAFPDVDQVNQKKTLPIPSLSGKRFSISAWGAYTYIDKLLQIEDEAYLAKRRTEEEPVWTTPTGISMDYFLNSNWTLGIGMGWSEYGEILNYDASYIDTTHFDGRYRSLSSFHKVIAVDSVRIIDSINVGHWNYTAIHEETDSIVVENNGRTSITYVEIPFTVGYRFGGGRVKPWVQSGISLGIPIQSSFRYAKAGGRELTGDEASASLAAFQWNYLLSLGIDCKVTRHWSLRVNALGSLQLNSALQNTSMSQRYYRFGASFGVAYYF